MMISMRIRDTFDLTFIIRLKYNKLSIFLFHNTKNILSKYLVKFRKIKVLSVYKKYVGIL